MSDANISRVLCVLAVILLLNAVASPAQAQIRFDLPAQPLAQALTRVGNLANLNIYFDPAVVDGLRAPPLKADLSAEDALTRLLAGTKLRVVRVDDNTLRIATESEVQHARSTDAPDNTGSAYTSRGVHLANIAADVEGSTSQDVQEEGAAGVDAKDARRAKKKREPSTVEEVVVTGSRLTQAAGEGAQEVSIYSRVQIEQSGQSSVADFLNTLPEVSVASTNFGFRSVGGATTVQLHGLPAGSTLVLINGRRIGPAGAQSAFSYNFFDLNTIPLAAIERIEVVPVGSSAVYGSDAIAGVVNIILKKDFEGGELEGRYGAASGTNEKDAQFAWGERGSRGSFSIVGSYESQAELEGLERSLTSTGDYRPFGGPDTRIPGFCSPGNVYALGGASLPGLGAATYAAVPVGFRGTPSQQEFTGTAGTQNTCNPVTYTSLIPAAQRGGVSAYGNFQLAPAVELFAEFLFSDIRQTAAELPPYLFGAPFFQQYTVSAMNPYNPFGEAVGVGASIASLGRQQTLLDTDFVRPLLGARGTFTGSWNWEVAVWTARDSSKVTETNILLPGAVQAALNAPEPARALNPFIDGPFGSPALLQSLVRDISLTSQSQKTAVNSFVRGSLLELPGGALDVLFGSEYDHDELDWSDAGGLVQAAGTSSAYQRNSYAFFGEARVPIIGTAARAGSTGALIASLAARYDHDEVFGGKATPQLGLEWHPMPSLMLRGTYGRAFQAPTLPALDGPAQLTLASVNDPKHGGGTVETNLLTGGNPNLKPETGHSTTVGLVYGNPTLAGFSGSITHWTIDEDNNITSSLVPQVIVDNESLFPGDVVRNAAGLITQVNDTYINFGAIRVRGLDYELGWRVMTAAGEFAPSLTATQTYRYAAALLPGTPATQRAGEANEDLNWSPKWKASARLDWKWGPWLVNLTGRYVGRYRDYDPLPNGDYLTLGNFWLVDGSVRVDFGKWLPTGGGVWQGTYAQVGAVNLFNTLPQFSNSLTYGAGYDGTQGDIRGRFLYVQLGIKW